MRAPTESFPAAAKRELENPQLRANLRNATETIRAKRGRVVAELPDWEELREAGRAIKADVLAHLDRYIVQFESAVEAAGGQVHWARDGAEANAVVADVARAHGVTEVVKVKSLTTDETELNKALQSPEMRERLAQQFYEPLGGTPERFAAAMRADQERYGRAIKVAGIKPE